MVIEMTPEARSRFITVTIGKESRRVHYKDLWSMLYVLGDAKYQEAMLPVRKEERLVFSRKLQIQAKKDLKEGEVITVWVEFDVARDVAQAIAEKNGAKVLEQSDELSTPSSVQADAKEATLTALPEG